MGRSRWEASAAVLACVLFGMPTVARGEPGATRVQTTDPTVARLLADGAAHSPTFARLRERLELSEWFVFVERGPCPNRAAATCLLHTVGRYEGKRYLRVLLAPWPLVHPYREISTLGHELQHALEAAEAPDVIDAPSLADLFRRIGYVSAKSRGSLIFETKAARRVEGDVLREMRGK